MINKDEINTIATATSEIIKAVPVYQDAVQPGAQEIGKALKTVGGVINVALAPLEAMVYGYDVIKEQLKKRLEKRLAGVAPENITTPKLQVVGPLLEKYKFVHESEELSQMFINLLANAMDKEQIKKAHPSFVNVISELSPDEARLLKTIAAESVLPKIDLKATVSQNKEGEPNQGFTDVFINFTVLGEKAHLEYPELTPSYLSNLERLNIISCPVGGLSDSYTHKEHYVPLENHTLVLALKEELEKRGKKIEIQQGIIRKTDFGKLFIEAVLSDK